jgi:hypothetical protein
MTHKNELPTDDDQDTVREAIRRSLNEIAAQLNSALIAAGIACPVYICVPMSGDALVTLATPLDPSDDEWNRVSQIACQIVSEKTGITQLRSRGLVCAMAGTAMGAAELAVG